MQAAVFGVIPPVSGLQGDGVKFLSDMALVDE
jgi:hypothetical protein